MYVPSQLLTFIFTCTIMSYQSNFRNFKHLALFRIPEQEKIMNYFTNILYMINYIFLMVFIFFFILHRYSKRTTFLICFSSFCLLTFLDFFKLNIFPDSKLSYVITTIIQIIITQSVAIIISKKRDTKILFMGLSSSNYVIAGSTMAIILHIYTGNEIISILGSVIVHIAILLFLYFRLRKICLKCQEMEYLKNWWELCLIPVFFYCSFTFLAYFPNRLYDIPDNILGVGIFIITMFVSYVVILRYVESQSENADIYWKNIFMKEYIKGLERQYYMLEQSERNMKILRHDMRHYSKIIDAMLAQKKYDEIKKITEHINNVADENKIIKYCNNLIANTIISKMMEKARFLGIKVNLDISIPKEIPVNDYEFTLVIANLFENAIICVKDFEENRKNIYVKVNCSEEHLLIHMKNEYDHQIEFDLTTGLPKSTNGENHGLGMQSVLSFSEKNGGETGCYLEDGFFNIILFAKF